MKLLFLGTGAAEGNPSAYCECVRCTKVRRSGGPDLRTRSSLRIGERHQIDLSPDMWWQMQRCGVSMRSVEHLLITHSHADHFALAEIFAKGMAAEPNPAPLAIYASRAVAEWIREHESALFELLDARNPERIWDKFPLHGLEPFRTYDIGGLRVTPVRGAHDALRGQEQSLNYLVETSSGARLLYACDTGWYEEESWEFLQGRRVAVLIMECTFAGRTDRPAKPRGHLDLASFLSMLDRMRAIGVTDQQTRVYSTHLNPHQGLSHHELQQRFDSGGHGVVVAFDGLEVELP